MSSALKQSTLTGEHDRDIGEITVPNSALVDMVRVLASVGDEARVHIGDGEIEGQVIDPSHVMQGNVSMVVEHDVDSETVGVSVETLYSQLGNKPRDVDATLGLRQPYGFIEVQDGPWDVKERVMMPDSDSIRDTAKPDVDLPVEVELDLAPLARFCTADRSGAIELQASESELRIAERADDTQYRALARRDIESGEEITAIYSPDFMGKIFGTLNGLGVEKITLSFGDAFPLLVAFETERLTGEYFLAPRIGA